MISLVYAIYVNLSHFLIIPRLLLMLNKNCSCEAMPCYGAKEWKSRCVVTSYRNTQWHLKLTTAWHSTLILSLNNLFFIIKGDIISLYIPWHVWIAKVLCLCLPLPQCMWWKAKQNNNNKIIEVPMYKCSLVSWNWEGTQAELRKFSWSKGLSILCHLASIQYLLLCSYPRTFSFQSHTKGKYMYENVHLDISNFCPF